MIKQGELVTESWIQSPAQPLVKSEERFLLTLVEYGSGLSSGSVMMGG